VGGEAYASAWKKFLEALAGEVNNAKQQAAEILGRAQAKSLPLAEQAEERLDSAKRLRGGMPLSELRPANEDGDDSSCF
jgi:hypothetical protein